MERRRWIVLNPSLGWIQGDVHASGAAAAAAIVERMLNVPTDNDSWSVHEAPRTFPDQTAAYVGSDPALLAAVRTMRATLVPNGRRALAMAS